MFDIKKMNLRENKSGLENLSQRETEQTVRIRPSIMALAKIFFWGVAVLILCIPLLAPLNSFYDVFFYLLFLGFYSSIAYMMTIKKTKLANTVFVVTGIAIFITAVVKEVNKNKSNQRTHSITASGSSE